MPIVADVLVTKYVLDPSGYQKGAAAVSASTQRTGQDMDAGIAKATALGRSLGQGLALAAQVAATALTAYGAAMVFASRRAGDFDAMVAALTAVEGSAKRATDQLARLRQIAAAPGLGFEEAISGYTGLRRSGLDQATSERVLREFGNQVALSGGGKAELDRVLRVVAQMASKPHLQGEELMQLTEAGIPGYALAKKAFGTSDTEELKKKGITSQVAIAGLLAELEKMPRVAGGAKNAWENLETAVSVSVASIGRGINEVFTPLLEKLGAGIEETESAGIFKELGETVAQILIGDMEGGGIAEAFIELGAYVVMGVKALKVFGDVVGRVAGFLLGVAGLLPGMGGLTAELAGIPQAGDDFKRVAMQKLQLQRAKAPSPMDKAWDEFMTKQGGTDAAVSQAASPQIRFLREIADNTKKQVEISRMIFGGGQQGALGATSVEIARLEAGAHRGGDRLGQAVERMVVPIVTRVIEKYLRSQPT